MADSIKDRDKYLAELGRFVNIFAFTEGMVFMFLSKISTLSKEDSTALLSGAKIDGCCSLIKRLYEARKQNVPEEISACLDQLAVINSFRNDILHWGIDVTGKTKNTVKAIPGREREYIVSQDDLVSATNDTKKVADYLACVAVPSLAKAPHHGKLVLPWQYKPAPQESTRQKKPATARKPKRQPKSSRG